jgi:peptidoglycan-associated lipoprotein
MQLSSKSFFNLFLMLSLAAFLALSASSCKSPKTTADGDDASAISEEDINADAASSDEGKAYGLQTIHFGFDSATLDSSAKGILKSNAGVLKDKQSVKIQVEGHCDERGGIQYNIALGERRANATRAYLIEHGVKADRITVVSYGKEKPIDSGHDEDAWAKNRRANFRITEK